MDSHSSELEQRIAARWKVQFEHIDTGEVNLRVANAGAADDRPLVMLIHGFPESWYSWRHQVEPLVTAGYRVAIPDVRGYGGSDKPESIEAYSLEALTADMAGLARRMSPERPVVIAGHDWGAPIAWYSALLYPETFCAVAGFSVPFVPPQKTVAIDLFRKLYTDNNLFHYMVYFQAPGVAEKELEKDPARTIRLFYTALAADAKHQAWPEQKPHGSLLFYGLPEPDLPRPWLSREDITYYANQFETSGFSGPLHRYRNFHTDSNFLKQTGKTIIQQPSLFVHGDSDMVNKMYPAGPAEAMRPFVSAHHHAKTLVNCGHWTQQECPDEVNDLLIGWLKSLPARLPQLSR